MQPQSWEPKADKHVEMQQLVQLPGQFCKQERALKNQREAFARPVVQNEFAKARLQASIAGLEAAVKEVEKEMGTFVQAREKEVFERLTAIPGIDKKTAIVPVALTRGMKGFDSAKQLASCFGLCPRIIQREGKSRHLQNGNGAHTEAIVFMRPVCQEVQQGLPGVVRTLAGTGQAKETRLNSRGQQITEASFRHCQE
ncbi:hypothetical protein FACS1894181_18370 [Bacteroidia bacterium]|nr:hypothetical protein FACS1894181_18370 [Bacteroidia bacterium]